MSILDFSNIHTFSLSRCQEPTKGGFANIYASVGCGALNAKCTAGFCAFLGVMLHGAETAFAKKRLFLVPEGESSFVILVMGAP